MKISAKTTHRVAWGLSWAAAAVVIAALAVIIGYVFFKGVGAISWEFLTTETIGGRHAEGGILSAILGTVYLVGLTVLIATPLGLGAGLYLAEYARDNWLTKLVRYAVETLAGVPSIVFGLFGFAFFVIVLDFSFSIISGALTMACLVLPTIIRTAEEAIKAVPQSHREASLALGTTKWQTVRRVVIPAAIPGIITAIILAIGRSVEETACLFLTMGGSPNMPDSIMDSSRTLALHLYILVMENRALEKALATGVVLIVIVIIVNGLTRWFSGRLVKRLQGG